MASKDFTKDFLQSKYDQLKTILAVAQDLGYAEETIRLCFKRLGIKTHQSLKPKITKQLLQTEYLALGSALKVAKKLQSSESTILTLLEKYQIPKFTQRKYQLDHDFFLRDNEESFYWAGFLAADGCVAPHKTGSKLPIRLELRLAIKDLEHLEKFRSDLKCENIIYHTETRHGKYCGVVLSSQKICEGLARFNVVPNKTYTIRLPDWLKGHPLVHHFIRGVTDGDGCWYIDPKDTLSYQLYGHGDFIEDLEAELMKAIPDLKKRKVNRFSRRPGGWTGYGQWGHGGNIICGKIFNFLYKDATVYLKRKYDKAKQGPILIVKKEAKKLLKLLLLTNI